MKSKILKQWLTFFSCICLLLSLTAMLSVSAFVERGAVEYETITYASPRRVWGSDSAGDVAGMGTRWIYEASSEKDGNFVAMVKNEYADEPADYTKLFSDQAEVTASLVSLWNGYLYLQTGWLGGSRDVAQTFVVPQDGILNIGEMLVERNFGNVEDPEQYVTGVEIAIYLNDTKIWPADDAWAVVGNAKTQEVCNKLTVPALSDLHVSSGDKVRFAVNAGENANYSDYVQWPVTLQLKTPKSAEGYDKVAYTAPTRLWGASSVGDTAGMGTRWIYEASSNKDGVFAVMTRKQDGDMPANGALFADEACASYAQLESLWGNGSLYLNVGWFAGSRDVSQTFVAPSDGYITTEAVTVERHYGNEEAVEAGVEIAVFLNDRKIWPEGEAWAEVGSGSTPVNRLTVPGLSAITVSKGDRLRFVVNAGKNANYDDRVQWPVTVNMFEKKAAPETTTTTESSTTTTTRPETTTTTASGAVTTTTGSPTTTTTGPAATTTTQSETTQSETAATTKPDLSHVKPRLYLSPREATEVGMKDIGPLWIYEYSTAKNADFTAMEKVRGLNGIRDQEALFSGGPAEAGGAKATLQYLYGKLQLQPNFYGDSINAVQTFVVPASGELSVEAATVLRHFGLGEDEVNYGDYAQQNVHIAVYLNETKLWPADDTWAAVGYDSEVFNQLSVPALPRMEVKKGDKLRFVVNSGNPDTFHYNDWVEWPVSINLYTAEGGENGGNSEGPETGSAEFPVIAAVVLAAAGLALLLTARTCTQKN